MPQRQRTKPHTFEDQIAAEKVRSEEQLAKTPHGPQRDALVKKIRQLETAVARASATKIIRRM